jgi:C-terminal processing protease CtpA/Prc
LVASTGAAFTLPPADPPPSVVRQGENKAYVSYQHEVHLPQQCNNQDATGRSLSRFHSTIMPRRGEARALVTGAQDEATLNDADPAMSDDDDFDDVERRRKERRKENQKKNPSCCITLLSCLMLIMFMAIGVLGLFTYRHHSYETAHPTIQEKKHLYNKNHTDDDDDDDDDNDDRISKASSTRDRIPIPIATENGKGEGTTANVENITLDRHNEKYIHYDPSSFLHQVHPFDLDVSAAGYDATFGAGIFMPPRLFDNDHFYEIVDEDLMGYLQHPSIVNHTLVFCAEGDLYVTSTHAWKGQKTDAAFGAMKLTTTVGNVLGPKLNPVYPHWVAFTATYSGRRDVYLMDLRGPRSPSLRLTYWDTAGGVSAVVGWTADGTALLIRALSNDISLPDNRLYKLKLQDSNPAGSQKRRTLSDGTAAGTTSAAFMNGNIRTMRVLQIDPVPLTQTMDAVEVGSCLYFVRFSQSSQTMRYTGGTAESLWAYCDDASSPPNPAYRLLRDDEYRGTSKNPELYEYDGQNYLFFLSDRGYKETPQQPEFQPDRMNIWAVHLENGRPSDLRDLIQITDVSCDFEGRVIREFAVDPVTLHATLRIGADLYHLPADVIQGKLKKAKNIRERRDRRLQDSISENFTDQPTTGPSASPTTSPSLTPSMDPSESPSSSPSFGPSQQPSVNPSQSPSLRPSLNPSTTPSMLPSGVPSAFPSGTPSAFPSSLPSTAPSAASTGGPSSLPSDAPTAMPTQPDATLEPSLPLTDQPTMDPLGASSTSQPSGTTSTLSPSEAGITIGDKTGLSAGENIVGNGTEFNVSSPVGVDAEWNEVPSDKNDTASAANDATSQNKVFERNSTLHDPTSSETVAGGNPQSHMPVAPMVQKKIMRTGVPSERHHAGHSDSLVRIPVVVHSDFQDQHERRIPVDMLRHMTSADIYETAVGTTHFLMTLRGQLWVSPVETSPVKQFEGAGMNLPSRHYRLAPGTMMGGSVRILAVCHVPNHVEDDSSDRRLAIILATDPASRTAEHAFYLVETHSDTTPLFLNLETMPKPFLGGDLSGGPTSEQGLGSIRANSVAVSPCGRRLAWTDTDGRICVMTMPQYQAVEPGQPAAYLVLPKENELGEAMIGDEVDLTWSPGGRFLAVNHNAKNQFRIISIADCGSPESDDEEKVADIGLERIVQATPSRFNSDSIYWGKSPADIHEFDRDSTMAQLFGFPKPDDVSTTLYFLSDRDIKTDVNSPWGWRQPSPHFKEKKAMYALPLKEAISTPTGHFVGGGASELRVDEVLLRQKTVKSLLDKGKESSDSNRRHLVEKATVPFSRVVRNIGKLMKRRGRRHRRIEENGDILPDVNSTDSSLHVDSTQYALDAAGLGDTLKVASFPKDRNVDFGPVDLTFARTAYRVGTIPDGDYHAILCQTPDDGSFVLIENAEKSLVLRILASGEYPSDVFDSSAFAPAGRYLASWGMSTSRDHFFVGFWPDGLTKVVPNSASGILRLKMDSELEDSIVDTSELNLSIWPSLEYRQMYSDAWRMLRDYFYDPEMTGIDWSAIHDRYFPLVSRCTKREELDDVLAQMASELSALHVFVYGGEYNDPYHGDSQLTKANEVASLGTVLKRSLEWKGYEIMTLPEPDPDFSSLDGGIAIYSPLSDQTLRHSGQRGLEVGDVIVGVNGESVMGVPDIHMLLRGMAGRSVRLDVVRRSSAEGGIIATETAGDGVKVDTIITVPLDPGYAGRLRYHAWEWKTEKLAKSLAKEAGFTVGYVHLQDMSGAQAEDAFARGFFPDYDKEAFILDVRHNRGGNIDSWVLNVLQRQSFMFWQSRDFNPNNGGLGWDEQFAFRGHIVVLIDEETASDGEGVARGISELGLGKLVGTRTWGGGIWLSSDNHLVDGGIASVGVSIYFESCLEFTLFLNPFLDLLCI